ncbi:MAG: TetR/AcrR family transcriptional regulator [Lachnospiraceae bacterium]|nr:TetR/AcrR family transcriptional regulator [Lachnospiraceae bacterium]
MNVREAQAVETKNKLLSSSRELFAKKGYKGTTVRAISQKAGLANGLLYHYFPEGKKEIFITLVAQDTDKIRISFDDKRNISRYEALPVYEMLEAIFTDFTHIIKENIDMIRIMIRESEAQNAFVASDLVNLIHDRSPWLCEIIKDKIKNGEIRDMDFDSSALFLEELFICRAIGLALDIDSEDICDTKSQLLHYITELWKP